MRLAKRLAGAAAPAAAFGATLVQKHSECASQPFAAKPRELAGRPTPHPKLVAMGALPYPAHHYARRPLPPTAERFIAVLSVEADDGSVREVLVVLKSAEGYATVAVLVDRERPDRVLNKLPTQRDYEAVLLAASQVAAAFLRMGVFPQLELLGNNSHSFDEARGAMVLGNDAEPFAPHVHIIGRGDIKHDYVSGVPLRGRTPYEVMAPRARTEKFQAGEAAVVAVGIAQSLAGVELHPSVSLALRKSGT